MGPLRTSFYPIIVLSGRVWRFAFDDGMVEGDDPEDSCYAGGDNGRFDSGR